MISPRSSRLIPMTPRSQEISTSPDCLTDGRKSQTSRRNKERNKYEKEKIPMAYSRHHTSDCTDSNDKERRRKETERGMCHHCNVCTLGKGSHVFIEIEDRHNVFSVYVRDGDCKVYDINGKISNFISL